MKEVVDPNVRRSLPQDRSPAPGKRKSYFEERGCVGFYLSQQVDGSTRLVTLRALVFVGFCNWANTLRRPPGRHGWSGRTLTFIQSRAETGSGRLERPQSPPRRESDNERARDRSSVTSREGGGTGDSRTSEGRTSYWKDSKVWEGRYPRPGTTTPQTDTGRAPTAGPGPSPRVEEEEDRPDPLTPVTPLLTPLETFWAGGGGPLSPTCREGRRVFSRR